ncbi:Signal peptidase I W [Frondihabitans sp. 762G35]|uniref:signal peptidase I n=1 Tax=Frondihabitans sp. 762G35 TaxID=1446794 RepID=UPI000D2211F9|nr:signal peptidase I [Frondihabitans sp. 762G35]ARC57726.1 Signal peptidase I W [Frondihabitans sp. 762G35]
MTDVTRIEAVTPTAEISGAPAPLDHPTRLRRTVRPSTVALWVGTLVVLAIVAAALVFQAHGGRWFVVQTPSMGTAAPVGTLVLTVPTPISDIRVGDVVTFRPPTERGVVYTHRVVTAGAPGLGTRGDINGATDPWTLAQGDLIGRVSLALPVAGWVARAFPILLVGTAFVLFATRLIAAPARRVSFRILGFSMLASLTVYVLRPLVGLVVLTTSVSGAGATAQVVSTGILPIRVSAKGGSSVDLVAGQVGSVTVPSLADLGHYSLSSALNLTVPEWFVFAAVCSIPLLWCFVVGLPATPGPVADEDPTA